MLVLDTSVIIEIGRNNLSVKTALEGMPDNHLAVTCFTVHEINVSRASRLSALVSELEIVDYGYLDSLESSSVEKELRLKGSLINQVDIFIAGICRGRQLLLVTCDRDFTKVTGLKVHLMEPRA